MAKQSPYYVSTAEAARRLGVTERHVRLLLTQGTLKGDRLGSGRAWLVRRDSLKKFQRHPTKGRPKAAIG